MHRMACWRVIKGKKAEMRKNTMQFGVQRALLFTRCPFKGRLTTVRFLLLLYETQTARCFLYRLKWPSARAWWRHGFGHYSHGQSTFRGTTATDVFGSSTCSIVLGVSVLLPETNKKIFVNMALLNSHCCCPNDIVMILRIRTIILSENVDSSFPAL